MGFVMKYMKNNNMILKDDIEDMFTSKVRLHTLYCDP